MSEIRVLHVVGDSRYGGGAQIILPLGLLAKREGWEVDILTTDPVFQEVVRNAGIGIVDLDVIRREIRLAWDLYGLARLVKFLRANPYTIVHTHTSKGGLIGRLAATLAGVPVIVHTVHGFAFHEASNAAARVIYCGIERVASHWCDSIACVSRFHRQWGLDLKIAAPDKVIAIPNGLPPERAQATKTRDEVRSELGLGDEELAIFSAGRLARQKGLEYLIRAVPQLLDRLGRPFRILIAGEGPLRDSLEKLCRVLHVERKISFLGFRHDMGNLLAAADLVVLPSLWEGLSISLLEAMAASKPIVTTGIGSNLEVVTSEETALLVEPGDVQQLADAIVRCASDEALAAALARNAAVVFRRDYTQQRMLDAYRRLYQEVMNVKRTARAYAAAHS